MPEGLEVNKRGCSFQKIMCKAGNGGILNNEKHETTRKNSWQVQRMLAVKAASHEIFSGRFVLFVVKEFRRC